MMKYLYSAGIELSYQVDMQFYGGIHYCWCSSKLNDFQQTPTSNPTQICKTYLGICTTGERHNTVCDEKISAILNGARLRHKAGIITDKQLYDINARIAGARYLDFIPVLYIIPITNTVRHRLKEVASEKKASPSSKEYLITDLRKEECVVIRFKDILNDTVTFNEELIPAKRGSLA